MKLRRLLLPALLALFIATSLFADEVILKDGRHFKGEVLKETTLSVSIRTVGGVLVFDRDEVADIIHKVEPKNAYREKADDLRTKSTAARLELARWCATHNLMDEARRELEILLLIDPENADAQSLLKRMAPQGKKTLPLRADVTLTDGSEVKGKLVNAVFSFETPYGLLRIPTQDIKSVELGERDKDAPDLVVAERFRATGSLAEELIVVDSKLGRLTIARKDVQSVAIYKPTAAELVELEFTTAMKDLNTAGLDVMLVIDTTDSMEGILKHLSQNSSGLVSTVRHFVPNTWFGVVAYRDHREFDPGDFEYTTKLFALTDKTEDFRAQLAQLKAKGGGDVPEAVLEGLAAAMTQGGWRPQSRRVLILIGDAPPHPEKNGLAKVTKLVGDWNKNTGGVVHSVDTTGFNRLMVEFRNIAQAGGGKTMVLNDETRIARDMVPLILGPEWRERFDQVYQGSDTPRPPETPEADPMRD